MLKKIALATVLGSLSLTAFAASAPLMTAAADNANFVGANVAAGVGYNMINFYDRYYSNDGVSHHDLGNNGFATQLSAGYNFALGSNWILGPEVHAQYNTTTESSSHDNGHRDYDTHTTLHWVYGVAAKLGYATSANNLFYVIAGPDWGRYRHENNSTNATLTNTENSTKLGLLLGVGAEQAMTTNWHVREQFGYDLFGTNKNTLSNGNVSKVQAQSGTFLVSAVYNF